MAHREQTESQISRQRPVNPHSEPAGGTVSLEAAMILERSRVKRFFKLLGPGLITGASDDDPSGIGTYAVAGASLGFTTLWTALFTLPLMIAALLTCARIGMVSGMGLAAVLRRHYARNLLYLTVIGLVIANTINAGADIGAMAAAINLLIPIPIAVLVLPVALAILALQIWGSYRVIARTFKWLTLALFAYVGSAVFARPDWSEVLKATFIPRLSFDSSFLAMIVAIFGTTISPYLFFWQADQEVEEEISFGRLTRAQRSEEHTSELQSLAYLVCRLLLEKKKKTIIIRYTQQTSPGQSMCSIRWRSLPGEPDAAVVDSRSVADQPSSPAVSALICMASPR